MTHYNLVISINTREPKKNLCHLQVQYVTIKVSYAALADVCCLQVIIVLD